MHLWQRAPAKHPFPVLGSVPEDLSEQKASTVLLHLKGGLGSPQSSTVTCKTGEQQALHLREKRQRKHLFISVRFQDSRTKPQADQSQNHTFLFQKMFISDQSFFFFTLLKTFPTTRLKGHPNCGHLCSNLTYRMNHIFTNKLPCT